MRSSLVSVIESAERRELKIRLATRYSHLNTEDATAPISETLIEETRHWLHEYPEALSLYSQALSKFEARIFYRNLLDDLRLALEKLLQSLFANQKSLENQLSHLGAYIGSKDGSPELANMFVRLIDYYAKYNNTYVKHSDAVIEEEIEFIFEITSSFMKHLIRLTRKE
jgi:hypothetical protein